MVTIREIGLINRSTVRHSESVDSGTVCGLLAEPDRLRVFSAIVLGAAGTEDLARAAGVSVAQAGKAIKKLAGGGLATVDPDGSVTAVTDAFKSAVRQAVDAEPAVTFDSDPVRDKLLRAVIRRGRLQAMPVDSAKVKVVMEYLAKRFDSGRRYHETEMDSVLKEFYHDHATLRRYLIDYGLMERDHGWYWCARVSAQS